VIDARAQRQVNQLKDRDDVLLSLATGNYRSRHIVPAPRAPVELNP
jgi:hypothetical protein